jgi:hypothetical protein
MVQSSKNRVVQGSRSGEPSQQPIAAPLVIGVTGHRDLTETPELARAIDSAVDRALKMLPPLKSSPVLPVALSPLAEGTDRLVARAVMAIPGSILEVVLPLEKDNYIQDFNTSRSREEFEDLLSTAAHIRILPEAASRNEAYEKVGRYVVDQCDILIAVWDGKPSGGQGGTADIVQYARDTECPIVIVRTDDHGSITVEWGHTLDTRPFRELDVYNSERVNAHEYEKQLQEMQTSFLSNAERSGLPVNDVDAIAQYIVRHYVQADITALRYQHYYHRIASLVHPLAVAAVATVALQVLFWPDRTWVVGFEILFMIAAVAVFWLSHRQRWHQKWIDYRFLAERFRSALFLAVAAVEVAPLRPPRYLSLAYSSKDWMVAAFSSVWSQRPRFPRLDTSKYDELREFLCSAWLDDQMLFHEKSAGRHGKRHSRSVIASYVLFILTILAAALHLSHVVSGYAGDILILAAILFPAGGASIAALRNHRDYLRNSMRSAEMARHLKELRNQLAETHDPVAFIALLKEIEETMLRENEDWRIVVRFHTPELPA